jgi:hypothetical protein
MKRQDVLFLAGVAACVAPFVFSGAVLEGYKTANLEHGILMGAVKFALLATLGEVIGLRIRTGRYNAPGFGILPRAVVWAGLGMAIACAFVVFPAGSIAWLGYMGLAVTGDTLKGAVTGLQVVTAFTISVAMNLIFAPWMMTLHRITDEHIARTGGTVAGLFRPIAVGDILARMNWPVMWGFVFKKTIPLFWIPAHTITFLLPERHRILFAALLGVLLGVVLSIASLMGTGTGTAPPLTRATGPLA